MNAVLAVLLRDLRLAWRAPGDSLNVVLFFVLTVVLFPLGIGPEIETLQRISVGVVWVMALLACLLSLDRLFRDDAEDGSLDLFALSPVALEFLVLSKVLAHWLISAVPLIVISPVLALSLHMPVEAFPALLSSLLLGTPTLSLIGAIGAALTLGSRKAGVLIGLLVLPLYIPVLIFGVAAVDAAAQGLPAQPHLLLLGGLLALFLPVAPVAAAAAIRQAQQ
ncbi:MAG: heme exporter protein CcmB [Alphaproteobacteria bacterium]|nr:heme exporter protein CcmB [Alphaproteobacteria bacterium]